jgi:hypothetical protein
MSDVLPRSMRKDPVRPGRRVVVEIDVLPLSQVIPGLDAPVPHGKQRVTVHEEDLPLLHAMVEPSMAELATAQRIYESALRDHFAKEFRDRSGNPLPIPEDRSQWSDEMHSAEFRFTETSVMAEFRRITRHDLNALGSVTEIAEAPPEISREAMLAADAVRYAGGYAAPPAPGYAEILARIERLEAENAALRAAASTEPAREKRAPKS